MKYLIAGLGNPGDEYKNTRHNIGFTILDALAEKKDLTFESSRLAFVTEFSFKSNIFHLIQPTTFMNRSGKAVSYWLSKLKIPLAQLLVIVDDKDLPFGKVRLRASGSDGTHNGLIDISVFLESNNYARLRVGIGNEFPQGRQVNFVLGEWMESEQKALGPLIKTSMEIIESFAAEGVDRTMNRYN